MRGVNKAILIGHLGKDPDTKTFPNGGSVTNTSLATSESWIDKTSGERKEATEWHNLVFNGKLSDVASQYLRKGSKVYVEGKIRTRKYEKNGEDRYITEIVVFDMQMLDSKKDGDQSRQSEPPTRTQRQPAPATESSGGGFVDDDIPFSKRHHKEW